MLVRNLVLVTPLLVSLALAQAQSPADQPARPSFSQLVNVDVLIDNHVRFLTRRYALSAEQEAYTRALLKQSADDYLNRHRDELFGLVDRLLEVRTGGDMDPAELMQWGARAQPLYEEAKTVIVSGNHQWRDILTEEQRRTHDLDLKQMYDSFAQTDQQLQRIVAGQMTLDEFRRGPARQGSQIAANAQQAQSPPVVSDPAGSRARTPTAQAPAPSPRDVSNGSRHAGSRTASNGAGPRSGRAARAQTSGPLSETTFKSQWEAYVQDFIQKYKLDEAQTQRAQAILKDCQEAGDRQVSRRRPEIERLDKKLQGLTAGGDAEKLKELQSIQQQRAKILEPLTEIFEKQLKPRLEKLPTRAQRQAYEATTRPAQGGITQTRQRAQRPTAAAPATPPAPMPQPMPAPQQQVAPQQQAPLPPSPVPQQEPTTAPDQPPPNEPQRPDDNPPE